MDVGIDAHVELLDNGHATGRILALQIKAGPSFLKECTDECYIFRTDSEHVKYWREHVLPVLICLCDLDAQLVYWQRVSCETTISTGKQYKIKIPVVQRIDIGSRSAFLDILTPIVPKSEKATERDLMEAPGRIRVTVTDSQFRAEWDSVSGAVDYQVVLHVKSLSDKWSGLFLMERHTNPTAVYTSHHEHNNYVVSVRARNKHGQFSDWRSTATPADPGGPPNPPFPVIVTRTNGTLRADWNPEKEGSTYYAQLFSEQPNREGGPWVPAGERGWISDTHTTWTDVDNGLTYMVAVRSRDEHGLSSDLVYAPPAGTNEPPPPNCVILTRADGTLTATWESVPEAVAYQVWYSSNGGHSWEYGPTKHPFNTITLPVINELSYIVQIWPCTATTRSRNGCLSDVAPPWHQGTHKVTVEGC